MIFEDKEKESLKFVIVGHVDHGKSTLIGRLLYDTNSLPEGKIEEIKSICDSLGKELEFSFILDNLEEERDQNITIDTTQIFFKTSKRDYTIVDAPGHVEFIKNMITGASQAEAAIIIIDAQENIQEQTRRHSYILSMLGLKQIIIAINKTDLINYDKNKFEQIKSEMLSFLKRLGISPNYVIPISAKNGDFIANKSKNMPWYEGPTLLEALDSFKAKETNENKPLRFSVQDVYMHDKRIIVGRVESGILKKEQEVLILPSSEKTTIESIEVFQKDNIKEAGTGECPGIVTKDKLFLDRGFIISDIKSPPKLTNEFKAHIFWMSQNPLKNKERINLKCSSQETPCEIELIKVSNSSTLEEIRGKEQLRNREVADVLIKTDKPIAVENFNYIPELGRFILEREETCAGGTITE